MARRTAPDAARRRATFTRGRNAETWALLALLVKGYRPLARRFSAAGGEIDLVVRRGRALVFVEVKARGVLDEALTAIDATKRRRFSRAARAWLARHPPRRTDTWRADAVYVTPGAWPRHQPCAFEIEGG